jgi:hypothetical protein
VLTHPDTPGRIYNPLSEAVAELTANDKVSEDPAVIAVALAVHKPEGEAAEQ